MKLIRRFHRNIWLWLLLFSLVLGIANSGWASDDAIRSKWTDNLLSVELGDVHIETNTMAGAWQEMATKYLLRANLFMDEPAISDTTTFAFHKEKTTGKELFDAFLTAYPAFTYKQDPLTAVIWIYPKRVNYNNILNQKIRITRQAVQVSMYKDVYIPLCKLLAPEVIDSDNLPMEGSVPIDPSTGKPPIPYFWLYNLDLPAGDYSAREMLNFCCAANPTKAFLIRSESGQQGRLVIFLENLLYQNPMAPPRVEAIKFWEVEIGKATKGTPSLEDIRMAMSDSHPDKRIAASFYVEACIANYSAFDLIGQAEGADQEVWTALGVEYALWRDADTKFLTGMMRSFPRLREDIKRIENPDLALLASLQLTREKQDTSYLDAIVDKHTYTAEEITSIKPELYRMARSSKAVRDKLRAMKFQVPELSPETLDELADTNLFTLIPEKQN
jgi:hypothetical protein